MELTLDSLKSAKAFSSKPVRKTIEWNGHTFDTYVRPISFQTAMGDISSASEGGAHILACRIASSLCDADGKAIMTPWDVTGEVVYSTPQKPGDKPEVIAGNPEAGPMDGELVKKLLIAINEVQNAGKIKS
jgi:hypothetical protein